MPDLIVIADEFEVIWRAAERLAAHLRDAGYTDKTDTVEALTEGVAAMQEDFKKLAGQEDGEGA